MEHITQPCDLSKLFYSHYLTFNYINAHLKLCTERFGLVIPQPFKRFRMNIIDHVERLNPHLGFACAPSSSPAERPWCRRKEKWNAHSFKTTDFPTFSGISQGIPAGEVVRNGTANHCCSANNILPLSSYIHSTSTGTTFSPRTQGIDL